MNTAVRFKRRYANTELKSNKVVEQAKVRQAHIPNRC